MLIEPIIKKVIETQNQESLIIQDQWSEIEKKRNDSESEKLVVNYTDKRGKNIRKASDELSEDWRENKKRETKIKARGK